MLTTFVTPYGRYRCLRLPFGLSVSSEIFQKHLHQALEGLPGVKCIAMMFLFTVQAMLTMRATWRVSCTDVNRKVSS